MDTLSVVALIVIALVILAVIIAFRQKISLTLKAWGIEWGVNAENPTPPPPAGVRAEGLESRKGGIVIEEGKSQTGTGIEAKNLKAADDILIGKGESSDPKAPPPA